MRDVPVRILEQAWVAAEASAWATHEAAVQAAEDAWTVAEAAASAAYDAAMATAMQAWNAAEPAAWAQYQANSLDRRKRPVSLDRGGGSHRRVGNAHGEVGPARYEVTSVAHWWAVLTLRLLAGATRW